MAFQTSSEYRSAWNSLKESGLLLASDPVFPSVTTLVAGAAVRGSWWSHPLARRIHALMEQLSGHPDVLTVKLLSGKITYVHRALWPAILAVARAHEPWQMKALPPSAVALLRRVTHEGRVDAEEAASTRATSARSPRAAIEALESRLLVLVGQAHTRTGAHARSLESWDHWAERVNFSGPSMASRLGMERILEAVRALCRRSGGTCRLPWESARRGPGD